MVSHKNHNLNANEGFVIFLTFKLTTCFINGFISKMKSKSIACLVSESGHIYWILDLEDMMHSRWVIWISGLQECKGNFIFQSQAEWATIFNQDLKILHFMWGLPGGARLQAPDPIHHPLKVHRGRVSVQ